MTITEKKLVKLTPLCKSNKGKLIQNFYFT